MRAGIAGITGVTNVTGVDTGVTGVDLGWTLTAGDGLPAELALV